MEKIYKYSCIVLLILVLILGIATITSSKKSYELGKLCSQYRERILDAKRTNNELRGTIEQCQSYCFDIGESVGRNIQNARDAIETIEELRVQVQYLENLIGDIDWNMYSEHWAIDMELE